MNNELEKLEKIIKRIKIKFSPQSDIIVEKKEKKCM